MASPFRTTRIIEFSDTDTACIVHFARFFCFMESAEHAFLRSLGLSVKMEWEGEEIGFPRVSAHCDYLQPARFEEEIAIEVIVERVGKKSVTYGFRVLRDETLLAEGQITTVCCRLDESGMHSCEIPPGIREKLQPTTEK